MMMDCVEGDINAGLRAFADATAADGTTIVKRALVGVKAALVATGAGAVTLCMPEPPEQLHNAHTVSKARMRVRISSPVR
jgi:hypothetical protein